MIAQATKAIARPEMSAKEYHEHKAIGASMLETFRKSRRKYHARHVAKDADAFTPTNAMDDGTLVHCLLLEPEKYESLLAPPPPEKAPDGKKWLRRAGSDHEKWWDEYLETTEGKIVADEERRKRIENAVASIMRNKRATMLLSQDGQPEHSAFWIDEETGLECKCRYDWFAPISVDVKTSADPAPEPYAKTIVNLGYHRKWAHYRAGLQALTGQNKFVHIVVGSQDPHLVGNYDIDDRDRDGIRLGEVQRRRTLRQLAACYESGDWREPWEKQITKLRLPGWAFTSDDYQLLGE